MSRSLTIAILNWTPGWEILLEWTGIPWRVVHNTSELTPERFAVVVVNKPLWREERDAVEGFVCEGGSALDVGRFLHYIYPEKIRRGWVTSLFPDQAHQLFSNIPILDLHGRGVSLRQDAELRGLLGFLPVGRGVVGLLGVDPDYILEDRRFRAKRFPGIDGRHPAERVARLGKGEIGLLLRRIFARLFAERGLPLVSRRRFPEGAENVFCFRIDSDFGTRQQIESLYDLARYTSTPMTWFLHTEGHSGWLSRFAEFDGQEIALHCARHRTFSDSERNRVNIEDARGAMRAAGLRAVGYAAPNGLWNHNLAQVIDEEGFAYSSEFTLAYDAFPFRPVLPIGRRVNRHFYRTLQIPIHPVSVGNLARVGISDERMIDYYRNVIDRKQQSQESLIFYHHPTHERWNVVEGIINSTKRVGVRPMTFRAYAEWWKKREEGSVSAMVVEDRLLIHSRGRDRSVWLDILFPDGTITQVEEDGEYNLESLPRETLPETPLRVEKVNHLRNVSFTVARRALRDYLTRIRR
ncbi:MAG: hypothetical protein AB7H80_07920 [Candidatus Kapaibacterium sp.]